MHLSSSLNPFLRRARSASVAALIFLACAIGQTPSVGANDHESIACSNRTLRGDYGFSFDGSIVLPAPAPSLLLRGLALQHFDGHGHFRQVDFVTLNGAPERSDWRPETGTYEVNADCTGSLELDFNDGSPSLHMRLVVVDDGRQVMTIVEGIASGAIGFKVR
jgi:hypothetical protein